MFKKNKHLQAVVMAGLALLLATCAPATTPARASGMTFAKNADGYADITVEQLASMLSQKGFTLINVHVPYEGEIAQTDMFIPYDQIGDHLDALPAKDAPIVLYCRSGRMSTDAAKVLAGLGYTNIMEVDGGFSAWESAGYELLKKP